MAHYLLIESRDPFDSADSKSFYDIAKGLASRGKETTFFLVQNGVLPARKGSKHNQDIAQLVQGKIKVLADDFSLKERAIGNIVDGVEKSSVDKLVSMMMESGTKAIWH